ncbi:protein phosphatase methylesterase 1-like isoform X2 [Ostrea edulis]|nr:protein phosphatase methylesterase 1-like isoform X2 [Ostrea edulis]XP_056010785.1 protein phosphatase methylesterase 1-like isoform X2 [Ostrea edulis]
MHNVKCGDNDTFRVYECGSEGPVVFFLHGGGFSALSWSLLSSTLSGLVTCQCAAVDIRGHGDSSTSDDTDLSAERLSSDVGNIVKEMYGDDPPPIILIGHSMGGAIAVHAAFRNLIPSLIGLVIIDVVEGTAMDSLSSMQSFLKGRPKVFKSLEQGIEWCVRSGQVRNVESARVSMVGQLKRVETEETATAELDHQFVTGSHSEGTSTIMEEDEDESNANPTKEELQPSEKNANSSPTSDSRTQPEFKTPAVPVTLNEDSHHYTWRIDLGKTEPFWRGWFEGLSTKFLSCVVPKMLLLAGVDRLDKELTIGQMQGKFQMQVLPQCGHAVHEDSPDRVAEVLATFLVRHKVAPPTADFHRTFPSC